MGERDDVTRLLRAVSEGRKEAVDDLMPVVYDHLKAVAHAHLGGERPGHTLRTTALVHEAYFKLVNIEVLEWQDRVHFFAMASRAMRRILIDYAKARKREKRGGGRIRVPLDDAFHVAEEHADDLLELDAALTLLQSVNERQCRVVEYRFFAGMTLEETAEALGISLATAKRDWALSRAWLNLQLAR